MAGAIEVPVDGGDIGFCKAENDLSAKQFYAVELSAEAQVDLCDAADDLVFGILQNKPAANAAADVRVYGVTKWVSDGTTPIAVNDKVGTDNAGRAIKVTADTKRVAGIALSASSAAGTIIYVLLTPGAMIAG